mgnify:CR=1 FL=1
MSTNVLRVAAILLVLSAAPAMADADSRHEREIASCKRKLASGVFKKRMEFAACVNLANGRWWTSTRAAHFDLFESAAAQELVAAQRFDAGRITEVEYQAARAKIKADLMTAIDARAASEAIATAPRSFTCFNTGFVTHCH